MSASASPAPKIQSQTSNDSGIKKTPIPAPRRRRSAVRGRRSSIVISSNDGQSPTVVPTPLMDSSNSNSSTATELLVRINSQREQQRNYLKSLTDERETWDKLAQKYELRKNRAVSSRDLPIVVPPTPKLSLEELTMKAQQNHRPRYELNRIMKIFRENNEDMETFQQKEIDQLREEHEKVWADIERKEKANDAFRQLLQAEDVNELKRQADMWKRKAQEAVETRKKNDIRLQRTHLLLSMMVT